MHVFQHQLVQTQFSYQLFRRILLPSCHSRLLSYQFLALLLVQKEPGTPEDKGLSLAIHYRQADYKAEASARIAAAA
jgi:hypothetical protein